MKEKTKIVSDAFIINEVQLILAEKRTSLSSVRTGIAVSALPLTVLSFLLVTSKYYEIQHAISLFVTVIVISSALAILGTYLIVRAMIKIHHYDQMIKKLKLKHSVLSDLV
jgi:Na+/melibiose symporter-like transporter